MARTRYRYTSDIGPYFVTQSIVGWLPVFAQPVFAQIVLQSWNFLRLHRQIKIHAFVVLENHLHWIVSGPQVGKRVKESKSYIARSIIDKMRAGVSSGALNDLVRLKLAWKLDQQYQLWEEGSHPQLVVDENMMWQKIEYIHNNPVRRGYVSDPSHWMYSSARNYARLSSYIQIDTDWR